MSNSEWIEARVDRTVFSVADGFDDDSADREYWLSRSPEERLEHLETLRRITYGYSADARLQRVLEIASVTWG